MTENKTDKTPKIEDLLGYERKGAGAILTIPFGSILLLTSRIATETPGLIFPDLEEKLQAPEEGVSNNSSTSPDVK